MEFLWNNVVEGSFLKLSGSFTQGHLWWKKSELCGTKVIFGSPQNNAKKTSQRQKFLQKFLEKQRLKTVAINLLFKICFSFLAKTMVSSVLHWRTQPRRYNNLWSYWNIMFHLFYKSLLLKSSKIFKPAKLFKVWQYKVTFIRKHNTFKCKFN